MSSWDERYGRDEYVYGLEPNEFVIESVRHIPQGNVLCLGEGEGRNAVFLAQQGYEVTAVDSSRIGLQKAEQLAQKRGVSITTITGDLAEFEIEPNQWQGIVSIFCHLERSLRRGVHRACVRGLAPGGAMILEAFTPEQLNYKTGGPRSVELLMTLKELKQEFHGLELKIAREVICDRREGLFHTGEAAVVQILGIKSVLP
jgi:2-polyprenyl-3-methyl-5-hydroxy-6-metoxy-1,4-benzoquinol methylase